MSVIRPKKRALKYDLAVSLSRKVGGNILFFVGISRSRLLSSSSVETAKCDLFTRTFHNLKIPCLLIYHFGMSLEF